jgi:hypothetical protein
MTVENLLDYSALGVILTVIIHLMATIWWAASLTKRVEHIERWVMHHERTAERLAALEAQVHTISNGIARIELYLARDREF